MLFIFPSPFSKNGFSWKLRKEILAERPTCESLQRTLCCVIRGDVQLRYLAFLNSAITEKGKTCISVSFCASENRRERNQTKPEGCETPKTLFSLLTPPPVFIMQHLLVSLEFCLKKFALQKSSIQFQLFTSALNLVSESQYSLKLLC